MKQNYLERVERFIVPFLIKNGFKLLKSEFVEEDHYWYLRLYIDLTEAEQLKRIEALKAARAAEDEDYALPSPEDEVQEILNEIDPDRAAAAREDEELLPGIDINDCAKVSRYLSKWLDKEDFISETYTLEVCSRGFLDDAADD